MTGEEPQYSRLAARLLAGYIDKEVRGQGIASFSQSVSLGHAEGLIGDQTATFVKDNARKLDDAIAHMRGLGVRVLRHQDRLRPLPAAPPVHPAGHRDPAVLPAAGGLRPEQDGGGGDRLLPDDVVAGLPAELADAVQLGHQPPADVLLLPGRLAARRPRLHLRPVRAGGQAEQVLRRHRHRLVAGPLPRRADPRHQRRVQRDRAVPADARRLGRGGEPGRPPQGRGLRLPGAVAPRHRGVPRAQGQHRRGGAAHPQPEPGQLDPGRVHAPGRGGRAVVADRPGRGARPARPVGRGVRRGLPGGRGGRPLRAPGQGPRPVRQDDAHAGADRQRLDDVQGRQQRQVQPDRRRPGTWCTCRTCAPRSPR